VERVSGVTKTASVQRQFGEGAGRLGWRRRAFRACDSGVAGRRDRRLFTWPNFDGTSWGRSPDPRAADGISLPWQAAGGTRIRRPPRGKPISMLLKITHETNLSYSDLISESVMELRMVPRQEADQHRLSFDLAIGPPTTASSYFDWLGNTVHAFTINAFHREIRIVATSVVETDRPAVEPWSYTDVWPVKLGGGDDYAMYDFLQFNGPVVDSPLLRQVVEGLHATDGMPLGELAGRIIDLINDRFTYRKGITTAASPITDMLEKGAGVCQDFTHLMIGIARALQVPARYVSGFLHPIGERFRGYTQTHAWCELWFPSVGWVGFDPANRCAVGENFVKVAVGRDFADVPPNKGLYRGSASETIDVAVHSEELTTIPPELAAERMQSLDIPIYPAGYAGHREMVAQQQEHQQQ
jgi:transglutaminase-like putative cysteine protease